MYVKIGLKDGKLIISNEHALKLFIEQCGGFVEGEVDRVKTKRTNQQNKFYWASVIKIVANVLYDAWGERLTPEQVHDILKTNCLPDKVFSTQLGEMVVVSKSTAQLSKYEFNEYLNRIRTFINDNFLIQIEFENE